MNLIKLLAIKAQQSTINQPFSWELVAAACLDTMKEALFSQENIKKTFKKYVDMDRASDPFAVPELAYKNSLNELWFNANRADYPENKAFHQDAVNVPLPAASSAPAPLFNVLDYVVVTFGSTYYDGRIMRIIFENASEPIYDVLYNQEGEFKRLEFYQSDIAPATVQA